MAQRKDSPRLNTTKLFSPPVPDDYVPRLRLKDKLNQIGQRPFALVSAPAGYGKTTAVSAWLSETPLHKAWLSLDDADNDPFLFMVYLLAAIRRAIPDFGDELELILEVGKYTFVDTFIDYLYVELDAVDKGIVLVLDDCHLIHDPEVLGLIRKLMRHPHPALHLVVLTRHDLQLPLSDWRARNQMIDVRSTDLRFNLEETAAFLRAASSRPLDDEIITTLHAKTEGWVAGLRLAILSVTYASESDESFLSLSFKNQHIVEYLADQVLAGLPAETHSFLIQTSILERMSGSLCDAVITSNGSGLDGQAMLLELNRENLFIVSLSEDQEWFRYHQLFRELLRNRLARKYSPQEVAEMHMKASRWFDAAGYTEEAIRHALTAGEVNEAVELVAANRHELLNQERLRRLLSWYEMLSDEVINSSPDLLLTKAWLAHMLRFDIEEVNTLVEEIDVLLGRLDLEPERLRCLLAETDVLRAITHYHKLDPAEALACCLRSLDVLPKSFYAIRNYGRIYAAVSLHMMGDMAGAYEMVRLGQAEDLSYPGIPRGRNSASAGFIHWMGADLASMEQTGKQLLAAASTTDHGNSTGWGHYFLACAYYQQNKLADAQYHAQIAFDNRFVSLGIFHLFSGLILALVYQAQSNEAKVRETMELANAYALEIRSSPFRDVVQAFQVELEIGQGQLNRVSQWANQVATRMKPGSMPFSYVPQLTLPKALLAVNDPANRQLLAGYLRTLHDHVEAIHNVRYLIDVLALEALYHDSEGNEAAALSALEESLALAEPSGFIRLYIDLGPRMKDLLTRFQRRNSSHLAGYVTRILAVPPASKSSRQDALIEPLTERELQVLNLLAKRFSNKEIARDLVVSPVTVKRHTINIYQKLNVQSRRDAVQAAQLLGIID